MFCRGLKLRVDLCLHTFNAMRSSYYAVVLANLKRQVDLNLCGVCAYLNNNRLV